MADYVSAYTGPQIDGLLSKVAPLEESVSKKAPLTMQASSLGEGEGWSSFLDSDQNITDLISRLFGLIHTGSVRFIRYAPYFGFAWANDSSGSNSGFVFEANNKVVCHNTFTDTQASLASGTDSQIFARIISGTPFSFTSYANTTLGNVTLTKSFGSSGYYKAPDGMMFCWGSSSNQTASFSVYYATAFYTTPYCVYTTSTGFGASAIESAGAAVVGTTYFTMKPRYIKRLSNGQSEYGNSGNTFMWLAIGRWK